MVGVRHWGVKKPKNINELSQIITGVSTSNFSGPVFEFIKGKNVVLTFENGMDWSIDGEHAASKSVVEISNIKRAVSIIK